MRAAYPLRFLSLLAIAAGGAGAVLWLNADWSLGQVSGRITVDGRPRAGIVLIMQPPDGRPSQGTTDADGHYVMRYTQDKDGVRVGQVSVLVDPFSAPVPAPYYHPFDTVEVHWGTNTYHVEMASPPPSEADLSLP